MSLTAQAADLKIWRGVRAAWSGFRNQLERPMAPYYLLIGSTALLLGLGLAMVLSASSVNAFSQQDNSYYWAIRQLQWVVIALPCAWLAARAPVRLIRALTWPMLLVSIVLLALTQTSMGVAVNGNQNWLALGPVQVQPSELAKFALVLWCAHVYALKDHLLGSFKHWFGPVVPGMLAVVGLVLMGGDLGTALVIFAIALGMLFVVGVPLRVFAVVTSVVVVTAVFFAARSPERLTRITSYLDPFAHFEDSGWQAAHGLLALASGGLFGKGLGAGQQKWGNLPYPHTDFVFAVLGEELGLVGTLLVLVLFVTMAWAALRIAISTDDLFVRYVIAGSMAWLMAHVVINIGMVLAWLPVIGIPLPFVSYGGSSLVPMLVIIGLMAGFARREGLRASGLK